MLLKKNEILKWSGKYDSDHRRWVIRERRLGKKFRSKKEVTVRDLIKVVNWKFESLKGRREMLLRQVRKNDERVLKTVSNVVFNLDTTADYYRIALLTIFDGVGVSIASTILTFYDPVNYGVFDIHAWRELFGEESKISYTIEGYIDFLNKVREIAKNVNLPIRTVEKALFKKNYNESRYPIKT